MDWFSRRHAPPGGVEDSKAVVDVGAEGGVDILWLVFAHPLEAGRPPLALWLL